MDWFDDAFARKRTTTTSTGYEVEEITGTKVSTSYA